MTGWWSDFWRNPAQATADTAFGSFTPAHFAALAVLALVVVAVVLGYRRAGADRRRTIRLVVGIAVIGLEVFRQVAFLVQGIYTPAILPLHLCAIAEFCVFIDALRPNSWCREYSYALGSWGPICAVAFPDWANQPIINIYSWQSFLIHGLLLAYILMLLVTREFRPSVRNLWKAVVIMAVAVGLAVTANTLWGTNFWFLNTGSPGSPLEPIQNATGAFYIPVLAVLLAVVLAALYVPWRRRVAPAGV